MNMRTAPSTARLSYFPQRATVVALAVMLAACGSSPVRSPERDTGKQPSGPTVVKPSVARAPTPAPALPPANSGRGGYYLDDGPGDAVPEGLAELPDAEPKVEPYAPRGNSPYKVFGKTYTPLVDDQPFVQRGVGSWYGKKFHGQKTSSGELYDMYKMTAAHPILPIPSYARITNLVNGKQVIVRINDRGPFHSNRVIDLSYTAALKLGYLSSGSAQLQVERLLPKDIEALAAERAKGMRTAPATVDVSATTESDGQASAPSAPVVPSAPGASVTTAASPVAVSSTAAPLKLATSLAGEPDEMARLMQSDTDAASKGDTVVGPGFYLQIGAFALADNAEAERARLMQNWDTSVPPLRVASVGRLYRLHAGPFDTREQASSVARRLLDMLQLKSVVVQR